MIRFLVRTAIFLSSAAVGILVAASVLDDVEVTAGGFLVVVVIYAVVQSVISPFLAKVAAKNATAFLGGIGLVATLVALIVATWFGDALEITGGITTWILASLIVWLITALATLLIPFILVKAGIESARRNRNG
jgi:hypothetical protein